MIIIAVNLLRMITKSVFYVKLFLSQFDSPKRLIKAYRSKNFNSEFYFHLNHLLMTGSFLKSQFI